MKNHKIISLVIISTFLLALTISGAAAAEEVAEDDVLNRITPYGAFSFKTVNFDYIQGTIDSINATLNSADSATIDIEEINTGLWPGLVVGAEYDLEFMEELSLSTEYEYNSLTESWHMENVDTGYRIQEDWDMNLQGISALVNYSILEEISLQGGMGYYFGDKEVSYSGEEDRNYQIDFEGSLAFKAGADVEYEVIDNLNVFGNVNYRLLDMQVVDRDNYYGADFSEDNFNGLGLRAGVSYNF